MCGRSARPGLAQPVAQAGPALVEPFDRLVDRRRVDLEPCAAGRGRAAAASRAGAGRPWLREHRDLDRRDGGQVARDLVPALALVGAREHLAGARAEVEAGHVERVDRDALAQHAEMRVALRQAAVEPLPARARVARAPDGRLAVGHAAPVPRVERDHVEACRGRAGARRRRSRTRSAGPR